MKTSPYHVCMLFLAITSYGQGKWIKIDNFQSKYVKERNVEIWLPDEYANHPGERFPVLYMHDGQNVFNRETAMGNIAWETDSTAQKLITENKIKPAIIVASWCTDLRYFEYFPEKAGAYLSPRDKKAMEGINEQWGVHQTEFLGDAYLKFMVKELKPYIDKNYRTLPDRENTSVCGSSMGGLISLYAICEYPKVFGQAACVSTHWPVLFDNTNMSPSEAIRSYLRKNLPDPKTHRIYFDHGTKTLDQYYDIHQKMVDKLMEEKGYVQGQNWVTRTFEGAEHNEKSWKSRMDVILEFLYGK